jgi:hypothetical protein
MLVRHKASHSPRPSVKCQECASLFDRLPASGSNLKANDLDWLGTSLHGLAFCGSKLSAQEAGDHVIIEPMGSHKQCFSSAMRAAGE